MFVLCALIVLACSRLVASVEIQADQQRAGSKPEPACTAEEFYYKSKCRNCNDLNNLFYNYQEWMAGEVNPISKDIVTADAETNARNKLNLTATITTISTNKAKIKDKERPKLNSVNKIENDIVEDAMLARLISVDGAQDQLDYIDSTGGDTGYIESGDQYADTATIGATKQTQKLVAGFLRTSLVENELLALVEQCRQYQNSSACQMWSNLCVITMYSYSDIAAASSPSSSSASIQQYPSYDSPHIARESSNQLETSNKPLADSNGWQKCKQFTPTSICNGLREWHRVERRTEVQNIYSLEDPQSKLNTGLSFRLNQVIQLLAYRYSYDGRLISVEQFGLADLASFCALGDNLARVNGSPASSSPEDNSIRVGKNMKLRCQFEPAQMLAHQKHFNETIFVDLYIAYPANGVMFVKPVPILIKNLIYNGFQVNRKKVAKDTSRLKLVHRFFFRSTFAFPVASDDSSERDGASKKQEQQVVVYAKSIALDLKFRQQEKGSAQLSSLMFLIDYGQFYPPQIERIASNSTSNPARRQIFDVEVAISHSLIDMQSYKKDLDLVITILSILSSIWSLIRCYNIQKCYGVVKLELETLIRFIVIGCDTLANLFALINFAFLGYLFVTLKFQTNIQVLAPGDELEAAIVTNLKLAFLFKLVGFAHKLHVLLNADIFFIDWEKPKMLTSNQILSHQTAYYNNQQQYQQQQAATKDGLRTNSFIERPLVGMLNQQQSSFWRPYTIISRWLQLQTVRRQDVTLHLLLFVCLIDYFQFTNLATADLNLDLSWNNNQSAPSSTKANINAEWLLLPQLSGAFRLLMLAIIYIALSMCQIFYKKFMSEPMFRNTIREFVDLCSVANVSLFCMLYPRFGYYIHGRNANGSGECGVAEMNVLLEREERDLCSKRGLAPNSDKQTFLLILPRIINDHYRKLLFSYDLVASYNQEQQFTPTIEAGIVRQDAQSANNNKFSSSSSSNGLLKSALNLSLAGATSSTSRSFSSNRAFIESIMVKNKAINGFLINFLEHFYKDIDYSIRERRRFENLLFDVDFDETNDLTGAGLLNSTRSNAATTLSAGGATNNVAAAISGARFNGRPPQPPLMGNPHQATIMGNKFTAATLCEDHQDSFTSLLWLGLEFDLVFLELFSLLILDCWLDQALILTASFVWILHQSFKSIYIYLAKQNLVCKALVDEKFLLLA